MLDDVVAGAVGEKHEAHPGSLTGIPVVFVVILLLLGQRLHQDRSDVSQGSFRVEPEKKMLK